MKGKPSPKANAIFVKNGEVFFLTHPPKAVLKRLEELGLRFKKKIVWCG